LTRIEARKSDETPVTERHPYGELPVAVLAAAFTIFKLSITP
jgi:hypothetical protein